MTYATLEHDPVPVWAGFARALRAAGVPASADRVATSLRALDLLDPRRREDVYWAGRLTLCAQPDDLDRYDRAFELYFAGAAIPPVQRPQPVDVVRRVATGEPPEAGDERVDETASTASELEVLRARDLKALSGAEREEVRRLIARLAPVADLRLSRRFRPAHRGALDRSRTLRAVLRRGGEPAGLRYHRKQVRPRRLVLLVDVSGSMQPYADAYLRFAHAAVRARTGTEAFTIGTRLTRVTRELRQRDPSAALTAASASVPDWSGGTRLGDLLRDFLDRWGQRGLARGAVVVIASDGWERGDAALLGEQMARLHRLAHRVVWVNPHRGQPGYAPLTAGMAAALPYVDDFVAGHTLDSIERLASLLADPRQVTHA
jgi:hypothetical protein